MKLLLRLRKAAETTYPRTMAKAIPPVTTAAKVNTLRLYLRARAKKNPIIIAPTNSTMVTIHMPFSAIADMVGISYAVSPPVRWKALKISQPSQAPIISAMIYMMPLMTDMRRVAIIPTVMSGLRHAPEKA